MEESSRGRGSAARTANGPPKRDCLQYLPQPAPGARPYASWPPWRFAVLGATVAALTTGRSRPDALPGTLKMRRRQLGGLLAAQLPDVPGQPPQPTYLAWLDCRHIADGGQPRNVFPGRGRVALEPGPRLGTPGSGFVRLTFGTSEAVLAEAIERMASALS